ncbi:uncharacterized protein LY89DRAFT_653420 [Mollisia scopiformis]|uniref:Uncharacterized protein n=1 Tax=Mollisia scopiformis TaxID=149040 RepID=A0A194WWE9_MOLSC|nr:uncharacterized protein LY89DRAFT_653420 [Mollisia scopiformis]KUJ11907.1 hypothetical protein LY89DRAFT_653420 [Mollisia scopiformis]
MPEIIHAPSHPFKALGFKHRVGEPQFKHLFQGLPYLPNTNTPNPNNYLFSLALQKSFYSPIHKHNFEQFRYAHSGSFSISPSLTIEEGELCYHPEGVEYGPQNDVEDGVEHILLILQFGGTSGQGYLAYEELLGVQKELAEKGRFEGGRYFADGKEKEGVDGFQACWETVNGRDLVYPAPRYAGPVLVKPQNFGWVRKGEGVSKKVLGVFTERETRAEMWKVEDGGRFEAKAAEDALQLLFVTKGSGQVDGEELDRESAVRLVPGEEAVISSNRGMEILKLVIPEVPH